MNTVSNEIIAAAAGGFLAWLAVQAVSYCVVRMRLITYLVIQVNTRLHEAHEGRQWLQDVAREHGTAGVTPTLAPRYSADRAEDLHESRELVLRYLYRDEIERVTKFLTYLWEAEFLTEGLFKDLARYSRRATPLTADDERFIREKVRRITSIIDKWPHAITSIRDLPIDYAGVRGPDAIRVPAK